MEFMSCNKGPNLSSKLFTAAFQYNEFGCMEHFVVGLNQEHGKGNALFCNTLIHLFVLWMLCNHRKTVCC